LHQANAPPTSAGLVTCVENGAGYISNSDRFHTDTAGEEYALRQEMHRKREMALEFRKKQVSKVLIRFCNPLMANINLGI
jgi:hypothetical protein